jgi:type III secretion protein P
MQIKQNIESRCLNSLKKSEDQEPLGNESNALQSRFEHAMTDKKHSAKQRKCSKHSDQTSTSETHLVDDTKLNCGQGLNFVVTSSNSQESEADKLTKSSVNSINRNTLLETNAKEDKRLTPSEHKMSKPILQESQLDINPSVKVEYGQGSHFHSLTQGDLILKNMSNQPSQRDLPNLVSQLVEQIQVSLPASGKEVRLLLNDGQLKGGEIQLKLDSQGYNITIRHDNALSLVNQQARQELSERLNRLGLDQPIKVNVTEQTDQHHDQQHSRQQRSIYDEWQPEESS